MFEEICPILDDAMQTQFHPNGFWHKVDLKHVPQTTQELHDMSTIPYANMFQLYIPIYFSSHDLH